MTGSGSNGRDGVARVMHLGGAVNYLRGLHVCDQSSVPLFTKTMARATLNLVWAEGTGWTCTLSKRPEGARWGDSPQTVWSRLTLGELLDVVDQELQQLERGPFD